ncbi:hypothetical protein [Rhodoferax antarcticus]|nr:hypothetical protein [Rhodoferax antarcticus]
MISIGAAQLAERDLWDQKLMQGDCDLEAALMMVLHIGAPASPYLIARLEQAFMSYRDGLFDDLATPFGCAINQREKQREKHETHRSNVKFHVQSFSEQGYPLLNPNNYPETESAFTKTADLLKTVTATTAFDIHYDRDTRKRKARK